MQGYSKTRGSILVVSTLILSMLAGLSIATLQNVVTEYKLTNQNQDYNLALSSAQYAVAEAKRLVLTNWAPGATACATVSGCAAQNGIAVWSYSAFSGASDFRQQPASYFNDAQATAKSPHPLVFKPPRFFVIDLGCDPYSKVNIYRIIAIGFGASANTVAYADSQLTMPLTGQNSYANVPTTAVTGVAVPVTNPALPTQTTYNLAPSTNSKNLFFNTGPKSCNYPNAGQSKSTGATCEMNCLGEVRVKGYSSYNNTKCPWVYGDWVKMDGSSQSQLTLLSSATGSVNLRCGPCGIISVPLSVCPGSGQYNSCAPAGCVPPPLCPAGQFLNGSSCENCPAGTFSAVGASSCTTCTNGQTWNGSSCWCPPGYYTKDGECKICSAGTYSGANATRCIQCDTGVPYWGASGSTAGSSSCTICPNGTCWKHSSASCQCNCGFSTSHWVGSRCITCSIGQGFNGTACYSCPSGQSWVNSPGTAAQSLQRNYPNLTCVGKCGGGSVPALSGSLGIDASGNPYNFTSTKCVCMTSSWKFDGDWDGVHNCGTLHSY